MFFPVVSEEVQKLRICNIMGWNNFSLLDSSQWWHSRCLTCSNCSFVLYLKKFCSWKALGRKLYRSETRDLDPLILVQYSLPPHAASAAQPAIGLLVTQPFFFFFNRGIIDILLDSRSIVDENLQVLVILTFYFLCLWLEFNTIFFF